MSDSLCFLMEESPTPVYQRILLAFHDALIKAGHHVTWLRLAEVKSLQDILKPICDDCVDAVLITNNYGLLSTHLKDAGRFVFELSDKPIVFIHHDNLFSTYNDVKTIAKKIQAFKRVNQRSYHFCIESYNCQDLECLGIDQVHKISHASEFITSKESNNNYVSALSFVGHVVPNTLTDGQDSLIPPLITSDFWGRIAKLDRKIEVTAKNYANNNVPDRLNIVEWLSAKHYYIAEIHRLSQIFRGEIVSRLGDLPIEIFGGDPGRLYGKRSPNIILKPNIKYHPTISDYPKVAEIYRGSKINLNITSLQFDDAVINRVIDVGAAGGFILTDAKYDLRNTTSVHKEISYKTIEELNTKIEYYLTHESERTEIARQLNIDVTSRHTYKSAVELLISKIQPN